MILEMWKKPTTKFSNVWDYKKHTDGGLKEKDWVSRGKTAAFYVIRVNRTQQRSEEAYDGKEHL